MIRLANVSSCFIIIYVVSLCIIIYLYIICNFIQVSSGTAHDCHMVLNFKTHPNVTIRSAVRCSAAFPFLIPPQSVTYFYDYSLPNHYDYCLLLLLANVAYYYELYMMYISVVGLLVFM
jgi:hypothetical protein